MKFIINKYLFSRVIALLLAIVISYFFARSEMIWLIIATIFVMQTTIGVALRQGIERYLILAVIVVLFSLFVPPWAISKLLARLYDVTIGSIIGILANLFIFPRRVDVEFRKALIPLLIAYSEYFISIMAFLFRDKNSQASVNNRQYQVEVTQSKCFPVWVYTAGLSVTLRPGHRHFLIMVERLSQVLFSMHYAARHKFDKEFLDDFNDVLTAYMNEATKIFQALEAVLNLDKLNEGVSDLADEVEQIEKKFQQYSSLGVLDVSKDYIYFAAILADLKDMRGIFIALIKALR